MSMTFETKPNAKSLFAAVVVAVARWEKMSYTLNLVITNKKDLEIDVPRVTAI